MGFSDLKSRNHLNKDELRKIIDGFILPEFKEYMPKSRQIMKDSLAYYLKRDISVMDRFWGMYNVLLHPNPDHAFFGWFGRNGLVRVFLSGLIDMSMRKVIPLI